MACGRSSWCSFLATKNNIFDVLMIRFVHKKTWNDMNPCLELERMSVFLWFFSDFFPWYDRKEDRLLAVIGGKVNLGSLTDQVSWRSLEKKSVEKPNKTKLESDSLSRWWLKQLCLSSIPDPWGNDPIWPLFFRWVETTSKILPQ